MAFLLYGMSLFSYHWLMLYHVLIFVCMYDLTIYTHIHVIIHKWPPWIWLCIDSSINDVQGPRFNVQCRCRSLCMYHWIANTQFKYYAKFNIYLSLKNLNYQGKGWRTVCSFYYVLKYINWYQIFESFLVLDRDWTG